MHFTTYVNPLRSLFLSFGDIVLTESRPEKGKIVFFIRENFAFFFFLLLETLTKKSLYVTNDITFTNGNINNLNEMIFPLILTICPIML